MISKAIDGKVETKTLFQQIENTVTKVKVVKNNLMKKRVKIICYLLDEYKAQGIKEGYRDILLFLLYNSQIRTQL